MNPRDTIATDVSLTERSEFYIHPATGRTHVRMPAGGTGGGITSYADVPASEEQHVAFLETQARLKAAEAEVLHARHVEAHDKLREKRDAQRAEGESSGAAAAEEDLNNPITSETDGRPPQHSEGLESQKGPHNPADERPSVDTQPKSAPVKDFVEQS